MKTMYNILEYGADASGKELSTPAFTAAIADLAKAGGGTLFVPAGTYYTGPIHFTANMTLHVDSGAVLLFSNHKEDFPIVTSRWEGSEETSYSPLLYAKEMDNIAVVGRGTLIGQGEAWWKALHAGELAHARPRFIYFERCNNVLIEGVTLLDSPAWTVNPVLCQNVTINKLSIKNPWDSPNTDGINPDSCKNVRISNCQIDVGDDCIAIKSGVETCPEFVPCENITITNCTMVHGHGGVVIGSEMSGGIRNVVISNCVFDGTDRGIRLKSRRGRGGYVEDIRIGTILMTNVDTPFVMNLYYFCGGKQGDTYVSGKEAIPVDDRTPAFRNIHLSNITAKEINACAGFIYGLPEQPVENITFDNVSIRLKEDGVPAKPAMMDDVEDVTQQGFFVRNAKNIRFSNVTITGHKGAAFDVQDSELVTIDTIVS